MQDRGQRLLHLWPARPRCGDRVRSAAPRRPDERDRRGAHDGAAPGKPGRTARRHALFTETEVLVP